MTLVKEIQMKKITSKNTNRTLRDTNDDSIAQSPKKYAFIVGYCCWPYA